MIQNNPVVCEYVPTKVAAAYMGVSQQWLEIARHKRIGPTTCGPAAGRSWREGTCGYLDVCRAEHGRAANHPARSRYDSGARQALVRRVPANHQG